MEIIREVGETAIPKKYPVLKGKIVDTRTFAGELVYELDNKGLYTERELEPVK